MTQPLFPSTISTQSPSVTFLTIKSMVRKNYQSNSHTGSSCLDKPVLGQRGGGVAQGLGNRLFAFGSAYWPLATAHSDPCGSERVSVGGMSLGTQCTETRS